MDIAHQLSEIRACTTQVNSPLTIRHEFPGLDRPIPSRDIRLGQRTEGLGIPKRMQSFEIIIRRTHSTARGHLWRAPHCLLYAVLNSVETSTDDVSCQRNRRYLSKAAFSQFRRRVGFPLGEQFNRVCETLLHHLKGGKGCEITGRKKTNALDNYTDQQRSVQGHYRPVV